VIERVAPTRFHEIGWRVVRDDASTCFATGSFGKGVELVEAIARLTDAAGPQPDVDLRPETVTVRVGSHDERQTEADLALAGAISDAARELGIAFDLAGLEVVQVSIDALVIPDVLPFWRAVLGYEHDGDAGLADRRRSNPPFWFQQMDEPRPQRNRIHIDVYVPRDEAESRIAAALAAGGRIVNEAHAPDWWTLADAEGNEVDVAPWPDLDASGD
jgi:4a-hydroxytetrahydrobiopterin dehydratase